MYASATIASEVEVDFMVVEVELDEGQRDLFPSSLYSCMIQVVFLPLGARPV